MSLAKQIANDLYKIEAIQIKPDRSFTWTSGIKSPIYCDNRLTMSYPEIRNRIAEAFVEKIKALPVQPDVIAGCATAGIPHAAWLAEKLGLPMIYVRAKAKAHGKGNQIEGKIETGQKVIVIEDLISTGGSSLNTALALEEEGIEVLGVMAIFTYGLEQAKTEFAAKNIDLSTITTFDILIEQLLEKEAITKTEQESLLEWRDTLALG